jgi:hypothetical protein
MASGASRSPKTLHPKPAEQSSNCLGEHQIGPRFEPSRPSLQVQMRQYEDEFAALERVAGPGVTATIRRVPERSSALLRAGRRHSRLVARSVVLPMDLNQLRRPRPT